MTATKKFLIDTNTIVTPYRSYYAFDLAKLFWERLEQHILDGDIIILDLVKNEIAHGNDDLSDWLKRFDNNIILNHKNKDIISNYREVLNHIALSDFYKEAALINWSQLDLADPWLIATGKTYGYTIVTFETRNPNLNAINKSRNAKIPDVCNVFGVSHTTLYDMMRQLSFNLST